MTDKQKNREFLLKYCNIMVTSLDNIEDQERMKEWLDAVTSGKCEEETSDMYLELILWALHTDRINVFPFKYPPPVDPGEINDAYKYALEIVQFEPDEDVSEKCGEVKTMVTDDLKEYLAVQAVPGFGTQCFYAFSDNAPLSRWNMPPDMNITQNELSSEPKYWMTLFSRPERTIKEPCKPVDEEKEEDEVEKDDDDGKDVEESEKSICPDLCKVELILNNLSFGGKKPQDIRTIIGEEDPGCNKRKSSVAESVDKSSRKSSGESSRKMSEESSRKSGESNRKSGESNRNSGESSRKSGESNRNSGESNRNSGESNRNSGESNRNSGESNRNSGESNRESTESNRKSSIKNTDVKIDTFLLSVDYPKNKYVEPPSTKKKEKKRKSVPSKKPKMTSPRTSLYPYWQTFSPDICSLDSNDQFTCKEDKSPSWVGYDMNMSSFPDDSTMVLCGNSLDEDKDYELSNMIQQYKIQQYKNYRRNSSIYNRSNKPSHQINDYPRSSNSFKNHFTGSNGRMPQNNGTQNSRFSRDRMDFEDVYSKRRRSRDDRIAYIPNASRNVNDKNQREPNYTRNYDSRLSASDPSPSSGGRHRERRGYSDNEPTDVSSLTSLTNSIRSQRRLHFSEDHVEPKQHRPNIFANAPLKPCLRKSSEEESCPLKMSDNYNRSQGSREHRRNDDPFTYPRSASMRGSSPSNYRSGNR